MVDTYVDNNENCIGCEACSAICPERSLYITESEYDGKTFFNAHLAKESQNCKKCIAKNGCALCAKICPKDAIEIISF